VRRILLLTLSAVAVMIGAGCRSDGRTLRDPGPDQTQSISTTAASTVPVVVDDGSLDTASTATPTSAATPLEPELSITAPWADGDPIDARYTCDGGNHVPPLAWSQPPEGTVEIAVTLTDRDAPDFVHWLIAGITPDVIGLTEDVVPIGAQQAMNTAGQIGYFGPCPPAGSTHHYVLQVHFLGASVGLTDGDPAAEVLPLIIAAEIGSAEVNGNFSRA
jgi:Raf kinase inhibitor-like YbhB/YbcL family protein